jgi:hypothetical protein
MHSIAESQILAVLGGRCRRAGPRRHRRGLRRVRQPSRTCRAARQPVPARRGAADALQGPWAGRRAGRQRARCALPSSPCCGKIIPPYAIAQPTVEAALEGAAAGATRRSPATVWPLRHPANATAARCRHWRRCRLRDAACWPSAANFLLVEFRRRRRCACERIAAAGLLVRDFRGQPWASSRSAAPDHVGTPEQNGTSCLEMPAHEGAYSSTGTGRSIEEPPDEQVDALAEDPLHAGGVRRAGANSRRCGLALGDRDQPGWARHGQLPDRRISTEPQRFVMDAFASQGIVPSTRCSSARISAGRRLRLPQAEDARSLDGLDPGQRASTSPPARSSAIAIPISSSPRASVSAAFGCARHGEAAETAGRPSRSALLARRSTVSSARSETRHHRARSTSTNRGRYARSRRASASSTTCSSSSASTVVSRSQLRLPVATCTSMSITPSRTVRSPSARRCGKALGDKRGIAALRLPVAHGRSARPGGDRPVRPCLRRVRGPVRARTGRRHAERAGAALLPLPRRLARRGGARVGGRRQHAPHDRSLLQGVGRALRQAFRRESDDLPTPRACSDARPRDCCVDRPATAAARVRPYAGGVRVSSR